MVEETKEVKPEAKVEAKEVKPEAKVEVPENLKKIVSAIEEMKVVDLAKLVKVLEKKFGVSAAPVMAPMAGAVAGSGGDANGEEKSSYDLVLTSSGSKKIAVIKVVKQITEKGLKDCKDLVDGADSEPQVIKSGLNKEDAEKMKKDLVDAGATVELK